MREDFSGFEMREVVGILWRRRAGVYPGALSPSSASVFSLTACNAGGFSGFEMREVVGDFMETPSWGSAFPGGVAPGSAEPQLGESFFLAACNAGGFSGFEMR